ncbi:DUF262 domain-containing protein [Paenibacillus oryzisoli]|uniref:DUF262 domain-containing protein n=1 Tax=Paenibacillus oryzisoli TaxID=1850517 RepID=UPI003D27BED6
MSTSAEANKQVGEMEINIKTHTISYLSNLRKDKSLRFDHAIQRNSVWKKRQKQLLADSVVHNFPIPPIFAYYSNDGVDWMIDGKQRTGSWLEFIENEFPFAKGTKPVRIRKNDGSGETELVEIEGKFFKDLPKSLQEKYLNREVSMIKVSNATDSQIEELFQRLNGGSALSRMELIRAKIGEDVRAYLNEVSTYPFFANYAFIGNNARNRFVDQELILQAMLLQKRSDSGISSNEIEGFVETLKRNGISKDDKNKFEETSTYLYDAFTQFVEIDNDAQTDDKVLNKVLKKIHIPMLFLTAIEAIEKKVHPIAFGEWAKDFLIERYTPGSGSYGTYCVAGSARKVNVQGRIGSMKNDFSSNIDKIAKLEQVKEEIQKVEDKSLS